MVIASWLEPNCRHSVYGRRVGLDGERILRLEDLGGFLAFNYHLDRRLIALGVDSQSQFYDLDVLLPLMQFCD